jgi:hypothetical protein
MDLERTVLVGLGVSHVFTTAAGQRAAVIMHFDAGASWNSRGARTGRSHVDPDR